MATQVVDWRRLRGHLAERRITHTDFARACGLHRAFVCRILCGTQQPGELAAIKIERAVRTLGLDEESIHATR